MVSARRRLRTSPACLPSLTRTRTASWSSRSCACCGARAVQGTGLAINLGSWWMDASSEQLPPRVPDTCCCACSAAAAAPGWGPTSQWRKPKRRFGCWTEHRAASYSLLILSSGGLGSGPPRRPRIRQPRLGDFEEESPLLCPLQCAVQLMRVFAAAAAAASCCSCSC